MEREHRVTEMPERINFRILFKDRPTFDHIIQLAPIGKRGRSPTAQGEHQTVTRFPISKIHVLFANGKIGQGGR